MLPYVSFLLSFSASSSPQVRIPGPLVSTPFVTLTGSHVLQSSNSQDVNARHIRKVTPTALRMLFFMVWDLNQR